MICVIGGKGSIGSRYCCIMRWHNIKHVVYDVNTPEIDLFSFKKYILCTPTNTHVEFLYRLQGKTVLCEKPISKNPSEIPNFDRMFTVCNWKYVANLMNQEYPFVINYDYYRTGPDGLYFDLSQILYMDPEARINNRSPKWNVSINGQMVAYRTLEESYNRMILDFVSDRYENLWTLQQGKQMVETVLERMQLDQRKTANV